MEDIQENDISGYQESETQRPDLVLQQPDQLLVATEKSDHTYHLGTCHLPGTAEEKMKELEVWRTSHLDRWQAFSAFMLCKKPYIAIGTLGPTVSAA